MNKKIKWLLISLFPVAGFSVIMFGGYSFARYGDDSPLYTVGGCFLIMIGAILFVRQIEKKKVPKT